MFKLFRFFTGIAALLSVLSAPVLCVAGPGASYVVVEQIEPSFIVFTGIPKDIDKEKFEKIKDAVAKDDHAQMFEWQEFTKRVQAYADSIIVINDYPDISTTEGLLCLLKKAPGAPWGLTWNGGIALTYNDYQHARRTYASYKENPKAHKPLHPRGDPVNPRGHLPFFGCMR